MRGFTISGACLVIVGLVFSLMSADTSAAQTQVRYNFTGSNFASPTERPTVRAAPSPTVTAAPSPTVTAALLSGPAQSGSSPRYAGKQIVEFSRPLAPGSVLIKTDERRLYFVLEGGKAIQYGVGVGREGFTWRGQKRISRKAEWPGWTPPARMIERERAKGVILPAYMPGGPANPLGARALYLGGSLFRIHGTNQPHTIGYAVSSGCIRMLNEEVIDLHDRVKIGALVIVE